MNTTLALVLVAGAAGVSAWFVTHRPQPRRAVAGATWLSVQTERVEPTTARAPIIGHGTVGPKRQVNIIPQVSGNLVFVHDDLLTGKIIPKSELLFEIDPRPYEARVRQAEAEVRALELTVARHDQEIENLRERIEPARRMMALEEANFEATKSLAAENGDGKRIVTETQLIADEQRLLKQKDALMQLEQALTIAPHTRAETEAQLEAARARLAQARLDLEHTKIACPFEARVESVAAHESQVVTAYFSVATLTDMEAFEISVGIDPRELRWLDEAARPEALEREDATEFAPVTVRSTLSGHELTWRGYVTRFERVDEATRTARLIVEVRQADLIARPAEASDEPATALSIGLFCRTELPARPLEEALLVPRHAVHDNECVYVFVPDGSGTGETGLLERRAVPVLRTMGDAVLVDYRGRSETELCELRPGEQVVVSPLTKPIVGMKVRLRDDSFGLPAATTALGAEQETLPDTAAMLRRLGDLPKRSTLAAMVKP